MRIPLLATALLLHFIVSAQTDTVRIMQYNLLNYGNAANPVAYKNVRLSTILQVAQPDILGVNEVRNDSAMCDSIKTVLGVGWGRGYYSNTNNQTQVNMLYWNTTKFGYMGQELVCNNLRDIVAYKLYYKDTISQPHDTIRLTVIVGHLKAGSNSQDEQDRSLETQEVATYLNSRDTGNYFFMGDFNLYDSGEPAYDNLVNNVFPGKKLYDPLNSPGSWHDDLSFAAIHTQSPRTITIGDGGATGGMDDRFDFILASGPVINGSMGVRYQTGSYQTLGQDGQHFNKGLNELPFVPYWQTYYEMSDHLPVTADFIFTATPAPTKIIANPLLVFSFNNPVSDKLTIIFRESARAIVDYKVYDVCGRIMIQDKIKTGTSEHYLETSNLAAGIYYLQLSASRERKVVRFIKY